MLTLGIMSVMIIMFLVLTNFVKVFVLKEQASSNAQQASIAATSVLYKEVDEAVEEYEDTIIGMGEDVIEGKTSQRKSKSVKISFLQRIRT